ncbi:unnamed protein product [Callosobruchus maculatus]|uniref:Saposin A-type domain-containing protein n=1 Tax=Callosobruchus maculatus TaxID=64391 RepID=A0A653BYW2_CALMS|nr:unnamed protein product [Callosobruchus maculatus]
MVKSLSSLLVILVSLNLLIDVTALLNPDKCSSDWCTPPFKCVKNVCKSQHEVKKPSQYYDILKPTLYGTTSTAMSGEV